MSVILLLLLFLPALALSEQGSWGQINQEQTRPEGWRQIVSESAFALESMGEMEGQPPNGTPLSLMGFGQYPRLDGSTVCVPMAMEFARQHLGLSDADAAGFVFFSTTHGAYENLIHKRPGGLMTIASQGAVMEEEHPVDMILATAPSPEETALAQAAGVTLVCEPVCLDAFVFITHVDNPVASLTLGQIREIYAGRITNWNQVGGEDKAIEAYQREPNSGSQTAMESLVMQGEPIAAADENMVDEGMGRLVSRVGEYRNDAESLGYTYQYYLEALYKSDQVKVLAIEGVAPTPENLQRGAYPLTASYYAVIRGGEENMAAGRFQQWLLSGEGQACIQQAGYVPLGAR
jgi:phosphate transport system substrate-binding protein